MFIAKNNDLVVLVKDTLKELKDGLNYRSYTSIEETDKDYVLYKGSFLTKEEAEKLEQEKINHLTCTALDIGLLLDIPNLVHFETGYSSFHGQAALNISGLVFLLLILYRIT